MMKVLMFEPTGGFWPYVPELSEALGAAGVDLYFLTSRLRAGEKLQNVHFLPNSRIMNPETYRRHSPGWLFDRAITGFQWLEERKRSLKQIHPDLLHIQSTVSVIDQFYVRQVRRSVPIVLTVHDVMPISDSAANRSPSAMRRMLQSADRLIVHSERNKQELIDLFATDEASIAVIAHGLTAGEIVEKKQACRNIGVDPAVRYILVFGGLRRSKGIDLAIHAFSRLRQTVGFPATKLLIAGVPPTREDLDLITTAIANSGASDQIVLRTDYIPEDQVASYFGAAEAVLLPYTKFHSQSGVLLQAYKYRVPVTVTDVGSLGETVRADGSGIVAASASPEDLAEALRLLIGTPEFYGRCVRNQQEAGKRYGWSHIARQTKTLYEEVLARS